MPGKVHHATLERRATLAPDVAVEVLQAFLATPAPDPDEAANIAELD